MEKIRFYLLFKNPTEALEHYNKVKICHLNEAYLDLYTVVNNYYDKHFNLPSFTTLEVSARSDKIYAKVLNIQKLHIDDSTLNIGIIVDALIDEHIQNEALSYIETLVNNITLLDAEEIKNEL